MEAVNEVKLQVSKEFPVPVERLFEAWVSEQDLKQWWHPMGNHLQEVRNDLHPGGEVTYIFATENGASRFTIGGTYEEVRENELLVYTWNWNVPTEAVQNSNFRLRVRFSGSGDNSRLDVTQENFSDEEAVHPHRQGWEKSLDELAQHLSGGK